VEDRHPDFAKDKRSESGFAHLGKGRRIGAGTRLESAQKNWATVTFLDAVTIF
jgi:hypothetical protein